MNLRRATARDAPTLAALNRFVHEPHLARRPEDFTVLEPEAVRAWFRERLDKATTAAWIAEQGETAVGYLLMFVHERDRSAFRHARRWCEIDQVAVDPAWRRRGVGRALMAAALDEADARGVRDVELSSWAFNGEAHNMFRRLGFEPRVVVFERRAHSPSPADGIAGGGPCD